MPTFNARYHNLASALAYNERLLDRRQHSAWLELGMVRRSLDHVVGGKLLDCPCGTGRIDPVLRERFTDITGVDSAAPMFHLYADGHPQRKGRIADIFRLPYRDHEFDWTVCHRFFHHLTSRADRVRLLESLDRVSQHGFAFYCRLSVPFSRRGRGRQQGRQTIDGTQLRRVVAAAGVRIEKVLYAAWPFSPKAMVVCTRAA